MANTEATQKFLAKVADLFRAHGLTAKDMALLNGRTFNATFVSEKTAKSAALAIGPVLEKISVYPGFDMLKVPVASGTVTRQETKVYRIRGFLPA